MSDVRSKDAAVRVQFVDDDVTKPLECASPMRVMRENSRVQHVRVGHDNRATFASCASSIAWRVSVVNDGRDRESRVAYELLNTGFLIARQGLRGVEVDRA